MKTFMVCAVVQTIMPMTTREAPMIATYRRPIKSESEPTKGHTPARARRFPSTCILFSHIRLVLSGLLGPYKPDPSIRATDISINVGRNATCEEKSDSGYI